MSLIKSIRNQKGLQNQLKYIPYFILCITFIWIKLHFIWNTW